MQGKKGLVFFAVVITALCLFYLSFTFVARGIEKDRLAYANDQKQLAIVDNKTNAEANAIEKEALANFKDSIWNKEVFFNWTYEEVKKKELNLGLDLQGGMHITLVVNAKEFLEGKSGFSKNVKFNTALANAKEAQKTSTSRFTDLFYKEWLAINEGEEGLLAKSVFYSRKNANKITREDDDDKVITWLNTEIEEAATLSKEILGKRIDEFGATQPIIEVVKSTGRIEIELPGVDDEERIKKRLSAAAQLKFMEVMKAEQSINVYNQLAQKFPKETVVIEETEGDTAVNEEDISLTGEDATEDKEEVKADAKPKTKEQIRPLFYANTQQDPQSGKLYATYVVLRKDKKELNTFLKRQDVVGLFPKGTSIYFGKTSVGSTGSTGEDATEVYFLKTGRNGMPLMGGPGAPDYVESARQGYTQTAPVRPNVLITLYTTR